MAAEQDNERVAVRTYVPAYQREAWDSHADELDMSRAEFVRMMVQAGRRDFDLDGNSHAESNNPPKGASLPVTPGVDGLEDQVLSLIEKNGPLSWDDLITKLSSRLEDRLDEVLSDLQERNRVHHMGRQGGYSVITDGE